MRWLMVQPGPFFSVADCHNGWAEALAGLGEDVFEYRLDERLMAYDSFHLPVGDIEDGKGTFRKAFPRAQAVQLAANGILSAAMQGWPDVVFLTSAFFVPEFVLKVLRARRMRIVMLFTETPYQTGQQLKMAQYADISLLNDPTGVEEYRAVCPRAEYAPHAYRPAVHYPDPDAAKLWDLSFIGTGFDSRVAFFERMDLAGLDVRFGGPWFDLPENSPLRDFGELDPEGCVDNTETAQIYRQSRTGINFYRRESEEDRAGQGWAIGPREVELAACGLWFARDPRPESDELFPMLPAFTSPEEAGDLIRWALAHPEDREEAALKARAAIQDRTFSNHARKLLAMLDN